MEVDESLVGSPGFKPVREALTLSWVGSIPTHLRHPSAGGAARVNGARRPARHRQPCSLPGSSHCIGSSGLPPARISKYTSKA